MLISKRYYRKIIDSFIACSFFQKYTIISSTLILLIFSSWGLHKWNENRKLDKYFIDQLVFAAQHENLLSEHCVLFDGAVEEMKKQGYNPHKINYILSCASKKHIKKMANHFK